LGRGFKKIGINGEQTENKETRVSPFRPMRYTVHIPKGKLVKHIFQKISPIERNGATGVFIFRLLSIDSVLVEIPDASLIISPRECLDSPSPLFSLEDRVSIYESEQVEGCVYELGGKKAVP
jgi:hypothetical protein